MDKCSAVIFDMDGLLLATEEVYTQVTSKVVARFGKTFDWELKSRMMGRSSTEAYQILIDALELPLTPDELANLQDPLLQQGFAHVSPMPGALKLTQILKDTGVPMALATSSSRSLYHRKTILHQEWFTCFRAIFTGDDVARLKPQPDIFLAAAKGLRRKPSECLVFEDAVAGVQAAKAAGMRVVAVIDSRADAAQYQQADLVLRSLEDFEPAPWIDGCL